MRIQALRSLYFTKRKQAISDCDSKSSSYYLIKIQEENLIRKASNTIFSAYCLEHLKIILRFEHCINMLQIAFTICESV